jgi:LDH2 family malate/lactate/ureidoglycolate dehydrogenase
LPGARRRALRDKARRDGISITQAQLAAIAAV